MKSKFYGALPLILPLFLSVCSCNVSRAQSADGSALTRAPEVHVESSFRPEGSRITSFIVTAEGARLMHGAQVFMGPGNQVRSLDVYSRGVVEQETRLHSNGATFRSLQMKWPQGNGHEAIYSTGHKVICSGTFKNGQRWSGSFLVKEYTAKEGAAVSAGKPSVMLYDFDRGRVVGKQTFDIQALLLPPDSWLMQNLVEALNESEIVITQQ